jgi:hypothetical protein
MQQVILLKAFTMGSFAATGTCIPAELIPPNLRLSASGPHTSSGPLGPPPPGPLAPEAAASPAACAMMTEVRVRVRLSSCWGAAPDSPGAALLPLNDVSVLSRFEPPGNTLMRRELSGTHLHRVAESQCQNNFIAQQYHSSPFTVTN